MSLASGVMPVGGAMSVRLEYLPPVHKKVLAVLAHPPLVEERGGMRARRGLEKTAGAELGRHALGREHVVGRLAFELRAPGDVVVLQEAGPALTALQHLRDQLRRLHP